MTQTFAILLAALLLVLLAQHLRYFRNRRVLAQDQQHIFHATEVFHVGIFFKVRNGQKVIDTTRNFSHQILSGGDAQLVYAGQASFSLHSEQFGEHEWDGVMLFELPSRERFNNAYKERFRRARELFADSYMHGMYRDARQSGLTPFKQLKLRLLDLIRGKWRAEPLVDLPELKALPKYDDIRGQLSRLHALNAVNAQALVVFNVVTHKRPEPSAPTPDYNNQLHARLAALGLGPLHIGRFKRLEHNSRFDFVFVMHYPSARYFAQLLSSQFYDTLVNNYRVVDAMIVPTVPITDRL